MAIDAKLGQRLEAAPVHSPVHQSRLSLDPRLAQELVQAGRVTSETAEQLTQYIATSKWSSSERAVYGAVVDGFATKEQLEAVTGLTSSKVQTIVDKLEKRGALRKISEV